MSKFLITGGAGFIGSNIAEYLLNQGHFVRVLDNLDAGSLKNLEFAKDLDKNQFEFIQGDITNPSDCTNACDNIDYVLHHAGLLSVPESIKKPQLYNQINIDGTLNMLQASHLQKVKRFILASSSAIYGTNTHMPENETMMPLLISPYALTKLASEYYCRIFTENFGLETICLRYFNVYGPKQSITGDYALVIPKFIHYMTNNQQPPIFGTGLQSRDFIYINDVISANIMAVTTPGIKHEVFNVASGTESTILDLVNTLNHILGKNIQPKFLPTRTGDVLRTSADISKIARSINYKPLIGFEEGLRRTVEYFTTNGASK